MQQVGQCLLLANTCLVIAAVQQYQNLQQGLNSKFKVSAASAPLLLMQFCQPVIKPKTLFMQLHVLQACQGLNRLCLFLTDPRNQALCTMPARMKLVKLVSCRLYA